MFALPERARRRPRRRGLELDQHERGGLVTDHAKEMAFRPPASLAFWSPLNESEEHARDRGMTIEAVLGLLPPPRFRTG
jgi:hypothetical protein